MTDQTRDVIIIGAGQAGLSVAYHLRRSGLSVALLDAQPGPGAAWRHAGPSLRLFSPASSSSLHGWMMPDPGEDYPTRDAMLAYLAAYEARYKFEIVRPVRVMAARRDDSGFVLDLDAGAPWRARALVSATGTWDSPVEPGIPGRERFEGRQRHSAHYAGPASYAGLRVLVVGGGNSGAQIMAELAPVCDATWVTLTPPRFLPEHIDGRHLFEQATRRFEAMQSGNTPPPPAASLGDVVQVASVREARAAGLLRERRMFVAMTPTGVIWPEGDEEAIDAIIWCTGFAPALSHLAPLGVIGADGRVAVDGSRSTREPLLWLVGYGEWTGFASATIIGVGRHARQAAREVQDALGAHRAT